MFEIGKGAAAKCRIALRNGATKEEEFAAKELAAAIGEIFGFAPRVIRERRGIKNAVFVGETRRAKAHYGAVYAALCTDETVLACDGENLYCFGKADRFSAAASVYAVYRFLEKYLGVRYLAPDETLYPARETLELAAFPPEIDRPDFRIRWYMAAETRLFPDFAVRRRVKDAYVPDPVGGSVYPYVASKNFHNFYKLVPPEIYQKDHPEWFDDRSGQLCFSQAGVRDVIFEKIAKEIEDNPDSVYFVIGQNDTTTPCGCEECAKLYEKYTPAGALIRFINDIARRVQRWKKSRCPDREIRIATFAYYFGHRPPVKKTEYGWAPIDESVVPEKNVYVLFSAIDYCFYHPLQDGSCAWNRNFNDIYRGWRAVAGERLMFWIYSANYSHYLYPFWNFPSLSANYRLMKESGTDFVIDQGPCEGAHTPLSELHTYVHSALLWNADADVPALVNEFVQGYYKDCAAEISAFLQTFSDRLAEEDGENGYHLRLYHLPEEMFSKKLFSEGFLNSLENLLARAEEKARAAADGEKLLRRVEELKVSVLFLRYMNETPTEEEAEKFAALCRACGVAKYKEDWRNGDYIEDLKDLMLHGKVLAY